MVGARTAKAIKLLVFLPGSGSSEFPSENTSCNPEIKLPKFHVIKLFKSIV